MIESDDDDGDYDFPLPLHSTSPLLVRLLNVVSVIILSKY